RTSPCCVLCFSTRILQLISAFLFPSSRHPRYLHSFPTRRSSDLVGVEHGLRAEGFHLALQPQPRADDARAGPVVVRRGEQPHAQDRKSTRLNSSHEWISYAVFCLKKKIKNNIERDDTVSNDLSAA